MESPIPRDSVTFQDAVPGGDIGDFDDRWDWITGSMLPAWQEAEDQLRDELEEFAR
jgi:hypothetical protein